MRVCVCVRVCVCSGTVARVFAAVVVDVVVCVCMCVRALKSMCCLLSSHLVRFTVLILLMFFLFLLHFR